MRKLKSYIVETNKKENGYTIIVEVKAMNKESACKKAKKMGYEVMKFYTRTKK